MHHETRARVVKSVSRSQAAPICHCLLILALSICATSDARAQDRSAVPDSVSKPVCVDAEVDGVRALSYDCLNRQLTPSATSRAPVALNPAEALATGPSNQVGTFNYSAESNRFGSNWGKSVFPQRPALPQAVPIQR